MQSSFAKKEEMLFLWPTIEVENLFVPYNQVHGIFKSLKRMDKLLKNGVFLDQCSERSSDWTNFELRRRFDWGETRTCWDCSRQNQQVENLIFETANFYDDILQNI